MFGRQTRKRKFVMKAQPEYGDSANVTVRYDYDKAIIRLNDNIDAQSIFSLCDEVELAADYYHYDFVDIHINSQGGSVPALEYFLTQLRGWRRRHDLTIGTLAISRVASAAAVILSLGDIGHRRAYPSAEILYHNARIATPEAYLTRSALQLLSKQLGRLDERMLNEIVEHVYENKVLTERFDEGGPAAAESAPYRWTRMTGIRTETADFTQLAEPSEMLCEIACAEGEPHLSRQQLETAYRTLSILDHSISPRVACDFLLIDHVLA